MQHLRFLKLVFAAFLLLPTAGFSVTYYWIASAAGNWNNVANWSTVSATGAAGTTLPGAADVATFTVSRLGNCTLNVNVTVSGINITGYTGSIVQNNTFTVTVGTDGWTQSSGVFLGGNSLIDVTGNFTVSGGDFRSTSNTLQIKGNYSYTGTAIFRHNNGQVILRDNNNNSTITRSATGTPQNFFKLTFAAPSFNKVWTITTGNTLITDNELRFSGGSIKGLNGGTIEVKGALISLDGGRCNGTTELLINGTTAQTITGETVDDGSQHFPPIRINKTAGTATFTNNVALVSLTRTAGTVNFTGCKVIFAQGGTQTLSGRFTGTNALSKLTIHPSLGNATLTVNDTVTITDTLHFRGTGTRTISMVKAASGYLRVRGNVWCNEVANGGSGTLIFNFEGTANQTIVGSTIGTTNYLGTIRVQKTAGTLTMINRIAVAGGWDYVSGTVEAATADVQFFGGNKSLSGSLTVGTLRFLPTGTTAIFTLTTGTIFTVNDLYEVSGPTSFGLNGGDLKLRGNIDITNSNQMQASTTLTSIEGTGNQLWSGAVAAGQGGLCNVTLNKTGGGTLYLSGVLNVQGNLTNNAGGSVSFDAASYQSTLVFTRTSTFSAKSPSGVELQPYNVQFRNTFNYVFGTNVTITNNIEILTGATLAAGSYTLSVGGDWINQNTTGGWTPGTSTIVFTGTGNHVISRTGGASQSFTNITFDRANSLTDLQCPVTVTGAMTLTAGKVISTATNLLSFPNNATCTGGGVGAFVSGPVRKTGDDAFVFPLGDVALADNVAYHPIAISAPAATTDVFEAIYYSTAPPAGTLPSDIQDLSLTGNWTLARIGAGSSQLRVTTYWNANVPPIDGFNTEVAYLNGTNWISLGQQAVNPSWPVGSVTAATLLTVSTTPIRIAIARPRLASGYANLERKLSDSYYITKGVFYFKFEDEYDYSQILAGGQTTNKHILSYRLLNAQNIDQAPAIQSFMSTNQLQSEYGDNRFRLNLSTASGILPAGYYVLEVTDEMNQKWFLRIQIY